VLNAEKNAKSHSNQTEADQCIAENAIPNEDQPEDINLVNNIYAVYVSLFPFSLHNNNR
jgi:hypothetical protein